MYNLIEYSDNFSKTSGNLQRFHRDVPFINENGAISNFSSHNSNNASFKYKTKIAGRIGDDGSENVKTRVPLKYLSNFWRTL